ncbi:MAG: hypothetical protein ACOYNY_24370, partial [Caldilineaceae bacterium]
MLDGLFVGRRTRSLGASRWLSFVVALLLTVAHHATPSVQAIAGQSPTVPAATVITVNTSTDLDSGSLTKTCTYTAGI